MGDVFEWLLKLAGGLGLPGIVAYLIIDKRRVKSAARVDERTEDARVVTADATALEAHVLAVEKAFRVERDSKDRRITELEREVREVETRCQRRTTELERQLAQKDETIAALRDEVGTLRAAVQELRSRLEA